MTVETLNPVQVSNIQESRTPAKACLIWMHGLGADSMDMEMLVHNLPLSDLPLRHIFLNAPIRPVTLNNGIEMRAWYDIPHNFSIKDEDQAGILASMAGIHAVIETQIREGISAEAIGLAGFSQGGAMALHAGLHYEKPLAGIAALSAYIPLSNTINRTLPLIQKKTPCFVAAGLHDNIVHYDWSKASEAHLQHAGYDNIDFYAYPMEHCICVDEMRDLSAWIRKYFNV